MFSMIFLLLCLLVHSATARCDACPFKECSNVIPVPNNLGGVASCTLCNNGDYEFHPCGQSSVNVDCKCETPAAPPPPPPVATPRVPPPTAPATPAPTTAWAAPLSSCSNVVSTNVASHIDDTSCRGCSNKTTNYPYYCEANQTNYWFCRCADVPPPPPVTFQTELFRVNEMWTPFNFPVKFLTPPVVILSVPPPYVFFAMVLQLRNVTESGFHARVSHDQGCHLSMTGPFAVAQYMAFFPSNNDKVVASKTSVQLCPTKTQVVLNISLTVRGVFAQVEYAVLRQEHEAIVFLPHIEVEDNRVRICLRPDAANTSFSGELFVHLLVLGPIDSWLSVAFQLQNTTMNATAQWGCNYKTFASVLPYGVAVCDRDLLKYPRYIGCAAPQNDTWQIGHEIVYVLNVNLTSVATNPSPGVKLVRTFNISTHQPGSRNCGDERQSQGARFAERMIAFPALNTANASAGVIAGIPPNVWVSVPRQEKAHLFLVFAGPGSATAHRIENGFHQISWTISDSRASGLGLSYDLFYIAMYTPTLEINEWSMHGISNATVGPFAAIMSPRSRFFTGTPLVITDGLLGNVSEDMYSVTSCNGAAVYMLAVSRTMASCNNSTQCIAEGVSPDLNKCPGVYVTEGGRRTMCMSGDWFLVSVIEPNINRLFGLQECFAEEFAGHCAGSLPRLLVGNITNMSIWLRGPLRTDMNGGYYRAFDHALSVTKRPLSESVLLAAMITSPPSAITVNNATVTEAVTINPEAVSIKGSKPVVPTSCMVLGSLGFKFTDPDGSNGSGEPCAKPGDPFLSVQMRGAGESSLFYVTSGGGGGGTERTVSLWVRFDDTSIPIPTPTPPVTSTASPTPTSTESAAPVPPPVAAITLSTTLTTPLHIVLLITLNTTTWESASVASVDMYYCRDPPWPATFRLVSSTLLEVTVAVPLPNRTQALADVVIALVLPANFTAAMHPFTLSQTVRIGAVPTPLTRAPTTDAPPRSTPAPLDVTLTDSVGAAAGVVATAGSASSPTSAANVALISVLGSNRCNPTAVINATKSVSWSTNPAHYLVANQYSASLANALLLAGILLLHAMVVLGVYAAKTRDLSQAVVDGKWPGMSAIPTIMLYHAVVANGWKETLHWESHTQGLVALACLGTVGVGAIAAASLTTRTVSDNAVYDADRKMWSSSTSGNVCQRFGAIFESFRLGRERTLAVELTHHFTLALCVNLNEITTCMTQLWTTLIMLILFTLLKFALWSRKYHVLNVTEGLGGVAQVMAVGLTLVYLRSGEYASEAASAYVAAGGLISVHSALSMAFWVYSKIRSPPVVLPVAKLSANPISGVFSEKLKRLNMKYGKPQQPFSL